MSNDNRIHIHFGNSVTSSDVKVTHNGKDVIGLIKIEIVVKVDSLIETKLTFVNLVMDELNSVLVNEIIDDSDIGL